MQPTRSYEETGLHIVDMIPRQNEVLNQMASDRDMVLVLALSQAAYIN